MPRIMPLGKLFMLAFLVFSLHQAQAAFTGLTYEVVETTAIGTTYRVYTNFDDTGDIMQAVYLSLIHI